MGNIKVIAGQMFEDGVLIKPEFGNPEHIKALKDAVEEREVLQDSKKAKLKIEQDGSNCVAIFSCKCKCGQKNSAEVKLENCLPENAMQRLNDNYYIWIHPFTCDDFMCNKYHSYFQFEGQIRAQFFECE